MLQHNAIICPFFDHLSCQCKISVKGIAKIFSGTCKHNFKLSPAKEINVLKHKMYEIHVYNLMQ